MFKDLGQATDPDTITRSGMYYMTANTSHAPGTSGYLLLHFDSGSRVAQIALINGSSSNYYVRTKPSGSGAVYSDWRKIVTDSDFGYYTLWSGDVSIAGNTINLADSLANYSYIIIETGSPGGYQWQIFPTGINNFDLKTWNISNSPSVVGIIEFWETRLIRKSNTQFQLGTDATGESWVKWSLDGTLGKSAEKTKATDLSVRRITGIK